jgi:hypothetical protein
MLDDRFHRLLGRNAESVNPAHLDAWMVEQEPQLKWLTVPVEVELKATQADATEWIWSKMLNVGEQEKIEPLSDTRQKQNNRPEVA